MKYIQVQFKQHDGTYSGKAYLYRSKLNFIMGGEYEIIADGTQSYTSPVKVVGIESKLTGYVGSLREITEATLLTAPPKSKSPIRQVQFNRKKSITTVVWADGEVTMVTCDPRDVFDEEKALALCFMKHFGYGDRGNFNDDIHKWCQ